MIFGPFFDPSPEVGAGGGGYNGSEGGTGAGSSLPWGVGGAVVRWVGFVWVIFRSRSRSDGMFFVDGSGPEPPKLVQRAFNEACWY